MRWAMVRDGIVEQVILLDDAAGFPVDAGVILVQHDSVNVGWTYADGMLIEPEPVIEPDVV